MARPKRIAMASGNARKRIQTTQLVKRLQENGLGNITPELTPGRVRSIEILLRKTLPDLTSATLEAGPDLKKTIEGFKLVFGD